MYAIRSYYEQGIAVGARIAIYRAAMYVAGGLSITLAAQFSWPIVNVLVLVDLGESSIEECLLTRRLSRTRDVNDEDPLLFLVSNRITSYNVCYTKLLRWSIS